MLNSKNLAVSRWDFDQRKTNMHLIASQCLHSNCSRIRITVPWHPSSCEFFHLIIDQFKLFPAGHLSVVPAMALRGPQESWDLRPEAAARHQEGCPHEQRQERSPGQPQLLSSDLKPLMGSMHKPQLSLKCFLYLLNLPLKTRLGYCLVKVEITSR